MYKNNSNQNNNNTLIVLFYFHHSSLQRESIFFLISFCSSGNLRPNHIFGGSVIVCASLAIFRSLQKTDNPHHHPYIRTPSPFARRCVVPDCGATPAYDTYAAYARAPQKPSSLRTRPRRGCLSRSWRANPLFILYEKQTIPRSYFIAPLTPNTSLHSRRSGPCERMHR